MMSLCAIKPSFTLCRSFSLSGPVKRLPPTSTLSPSAARQRNVNYINSAAHLPANRVKSGPMVLLGTVLPTMRQKKRKKPDIKDGKTSDNFPFRLACTATF